MPRILIAGCGYVGAATADLFHTAGWELEAWTRCAESAARLSGKPYLVRGVDISRRANLVECDGVFDVVIHCASSRGGDPEAYRRVYLQGARYLLQCFPASKLLFTSSTGVYAQRDGSWVTEQSATEPTRETSRILLAAENVVLQRGGIVARLAGIYGPGRSALLTKFLSGSAVIDPENDRFINQVHRDDIASALFFLLNGELSSSQIYNIVDDQPILQSECYRWLAQKLNRPLPPVGKSTPRKRGDTNKCVSNAKLHRLGWKLQYPTFVEAMEKSILPSFTHLIST